MNLGDQQIRACPRCGAPASSWARFCRECGAEVSSSVTLAAPDAEAAEQVPWRALESIPVWLAALIVTIVPALFFQCDRADDSLTNQLACDRLFVSVLAVNQVALLLFTLLWVRLRHKAGPRALGLRAPDARALRVGAATAAIGLALAYGITIVIGVLWELVTGAPLKTPEQVDFKADPSTLRLTILALSAVVLAPIAEEVFFRGFVYRGLRRWATPAVATAISATVFGVAHLIPLVILSTALLGVLLARVVEREGDLAPAIVAHGLFNAVGFGILVVTQSY